MSRNKDSSLNRPCLNRPCLNRPCLTTGCWTNTLLVSRSGEEAGKKWAGHYNGGGGGGTVTTWDPGFIHE